MINRRNILKGSAIFTGLAMVGASAIPAVAGSMAALGAGTFEGRSNHVTSGAVKIIEEDGRVFVELGDDFALDGGPDPRVGFGKDGAYAGNDGYLGALLSLNGKQRYALPSTMNANDFNEVYIWCEVAGVPLGVASVK